MKKYILALCLVLAWSSGARAGIVNNSGTTAEDSIGIAFELLDTLGNPVVAITGDSVWVYVWYPGGDLAIADSARIITDAKIATRNLTAGGNVMAFPSVKNEGA